MNIHGLKRIRQQQQNMKIYANGKCHNVRNLVFAFSGNIFF